MSTLIYKKVLALAIGGIMSLVSVPSATAVTAVVASTVASLSLTTDAYAKKDQLDHYDDANKHLDKAQDAYDKGKTRKGDKHLKKGLDSLGKASGNGVMVNPETGEGDVNPGRGF